VKTCTRKLSLGWDFCNSYKARRAGNVVGTIYSCEIFFFETVMLWRNKKKKVQMSPVCQGW